MHIYVSLTLTVQMKPYNCKYYLQTDVEKDNIKSSQAKNIHCTFKTKRYSEIKCTAHDARLLLVIHLYGHSLPKFLSLSLSLSLSMPVCLSFSPSLYNSVLFTSLCIMHDST